MGYFFKFSIILALISGGLLFLQAPGTPGFALCLISLICAAIVATVSSIILIFQRRKNQL